MNNPKYRLALECSREARAWREALRRTPAAARLHLLKKRARLLQKWKKQADRNKITATAYANLEEQVFIE